MDEKKLICEIENKINSFIQTNKIESPSPGFYIAIEKDKKLILDYSFGLENTNSAKKISKNTKFLSASLVKPIIKNYYLNAKPELIDTKVSKYLNTVNDSTKIKHLIDHTSGAWDYLEHLNETEINNGSLKEIVELILSKKAESIPGEKYSYSNSGYIILTRLLGTIEGNSYEETLRSYYASKGIDLDFTLNNLQAKVSGYLYKNNSYEEVEPTRHVTGWGDGCMYASPVEYFKCLNLFDETVLYPSDGPYGKFYWHSGGVPGVDSVCLSFKDKNINLVYFSNVTGFNPLFGDTILDLLEGKLTKLND